MPSKDEWESIKRNLSEITVIMQQFKDQFKKGGLSGEHFPEFMDIEIAAKYLKCPVSRIRHMVYVQRILKIHHIDLTRTVYISKKEMNDLPLKVSAIRANEKKQNKP